MAATLLLIQNAGSDHVDLVAHFHALNYRLINAEDVSSAIRLIDDNGVRPSAILVDIPEISEKKWICLRVLKNL